tara:strand:+ start:378 stop:695 length:318 start_codon:yes stop_codon:yes gene_type:complete
MNSVVIGFGFGGIAAALRLKAKNHKVILIEKHKDPGGRARVFKKNGFTFDEGPAVITIFGYLFALNFLNNYNELDQSIYKVIFIGLASLTFPHILLEYLLEKNGK